MFPVTDSRFAPYGYVLEGNFSDAVDYLLEKAGMPESGNLYVRDDEAFRLLPSSRAIQEKVFGFGAMEAGYCNGHNSKLNCMEFHACPEVNIAATDLVLLLALPEDIQNGKLDSKQAVPFLVKKGTAIVVRPYVLHFSPCRYKGEPFRCAVYLSEGTNRDLAFQPKDPMLWKENKWLLAHKETKQAKEGAYIGIEGDNIEVL